MLFPHPYSRPSKSIQPAPSKLSDPLFQSWALPAALAASIVALGTIFSGCKQVDNLQDMHDSTQHMDATTTVLKDTTLQVGAKTDLLLGNMTDMKGLTKGMSYTTEQLEKIAGSTYEDLRQGNSLETRTNRLKRMEDSVAIDSKISEAGKFMMAMEFQLWKKEIDGTADRESQYQDCMVELFRSAKNYMSGTTDTSPASTDGRMENLYALAAALHKINPNQQSQADRLGFKAVSVYDLITQALSLGAEIEAHTRLVGDVPAWVTEVLRAEPIAIYLLRLRYNFLGAMPLADVSQVKAEGWLGLNALLHQAEAFLLPWTPNFTDLNQSQIAYDILKMQYASDTGRFLRTIQVDPKLDHKLVKIWKHMRGNKSAQTAVDEAPGPRADLLVQLKNAVTNFRDGN